MSQTVLDRPAGTPARAESQVLDQLFDRLRKRLRPQDLKTAPLDEIADRMAAAVPQAAGAAWSELLGPVYTTASLTAFLGITRQAVNRAAHELRILRLICQNGDAVYPAFQFSQDGSVAPGLRQVLHALAQGIEDPWTWAQWLAAPTSAGRAIDRLRTGQLDAVLLQAHQDAASWAS
ncbi:MAG: hypothetical protein LBM66_07885 [Bifidobacteriaceae bacterium]|nr:hypothetical protein [Bifidobacteriaceae bacterium]